MEFDADKTTIKDLLTQKALYESPLFQRRYVWTTDELGEFWSDIEKALEESDSRRFLGAVTVHFKAKGTITKPDVYWVIDGQQRITTAYLALLAIATAARDRDAALSDSIINDYLVRKVDGKTHSRISPTLADFSAFKSIHEEAGVYLPAFAAIPKSDSSKLQTAYTWLLEKVKSTATNRDGELDLSGLEEIAEALLSNLDFVLIYLGNDHDPQEVFDRLNRAGIKLSLGELLKNVIFKPLDLASVDHGDVHVLESEVWQPFFSKLGSNSEERSSRLAEFIFPFAVVKNSSATKAKAIDVVERDWIDQFEGTASLKQVKSRIADMQARLPGYLSLRRGPAPSAYPQALQERLERIHRFDLPTICIPFFIEAEHAYQRTELPVDDYVRCIDIIESFMVRRAFAGYEPTGLHAIFKKLWNSSHGDPSLVRAGLQSATIVFPSDVDFRKAITTGNLYARRKHKYIMLEREREIAVALPSTELPAIQADHLIPQNPPLGAWPKMSAEQHAEILHTWGNLALMTKPENVIKSNRTWAETRELFGHAALFASAREVIDTFEQFGPEDVKMRNLELADWALQRWSEGPTAS